MQKTSLINKTVAITGASGGLGRALCEKILENGGALTVIDRNPKKQEALISELKTAYPDGKIEGLLADMEDFESVKALAEALKARPIDYLILNAGAYSIPRHKTALGLDNVFCINFVSPYYLTRALLPGIEARGGRVIAVGSIAHNYSKSDPLDEDFSTRERASLVYGNAKRHLMAAFFALAAEGKPISVTHPGISFTGITAHYPKLVFALIRHPMKIIFMKPKKAALSIYEGIFTPTADGEWIGPRFVGVWGIPKKKKLRTITAAEQKRLSEYAERLYTEICK
jgi:NAD(P)-dependent dehydrogenase (short-subunit alcohol dehydrogenase family)